MKYVIAFVLVGFLSLSDGQECYAKFNPSIDGYCSATDKCQGTILATENSCEQQEKCCIYGQAPPGSPACITGGEFNALYSTPRAGFLRRILNYAVNQAGICSNCYAKAAFLAISATMTNDFTSDEATGSDGDFTNDDNVYGNDRPGDGLRYRRRGFFGLRGRTMYERLQNMLPQYQSVNQPENVAIVENGMIITSRLWNNPNLLNETTLTAYADGTFYGFSMLWYKIDGDTAQLADAMKHYWKFLQAMQCTNNLKPGEGPICQYNKTHNGTCRVGCIRGLEEFGEYCGCSGENGPQCQNSPLHVRCCFDTCSQKLKMDLGLVVDASRNIHTLIYDLQNRFTNSLLRRVNVGENKTHVGIINYSNFAEIVTLLNIDYSLDQKLQRLNNYESHISNNAFTHLALQQAVTMFSSAHGLRQPEEGAAKVLLLITHSTGVDQIATIEAAQVLKTRGIHLISIRIGNDVDVNELDGVCTIPKRNNYFQITNMVIIEQKLNQFTSRICLEPLIILPNSTITVEIDKNKYQFLTIKIDIIGKKILITVTLLNGHVKLFFSFTSRNPKDPEDFIDYSSSKNSTHRSFYTKEGFHSARIYDRIRKGSNQEVTLSIDMPEVKPAFVYVGIKGTEDLNKFHVKFNDCGKIDCIMNSLSPSKIQLNIVLLFMSYLLHYF